MITVRPKGPTPQRGQNWTPIDKVVALGPRERSTATTLSRLTSQQALSQPPRQQSKQSYKCPITPSRYHKMLSPFNPASKALTTSLAVDHDLGGATFVGSKPIACWNSVCV
jgi:hypothetical protein